MAKAKLLRYLLKIIADHLDVLLVVQYAELTEIFNEVLLEGAAWTWLRVKVNFPLEIACDGMESHEN